MDGRPSDLQGAPPPFPPNLPHDRKTWMPAYAIPLQVLTTILFSIRILSRFSRNGGRVGLDDVFIIIGWAIATAATSLVVVACYKYGFDRHIWDVSPIAASKAAMVSWILALLFVWALAFTKFSVFLFYRRLVRGTYTNKIRYALWFGLAFTLAYTLALTIFVLTACFPVEATWRATDPTFHKKFKCQNPKLQVVIGLTVASLSVATDIYAVVLPALLLLQLKVTRRQRLGLLAVFSVGLFAGAAGTVRAAYQGLMMMGGLDKPWLNYNAFAAGIAEVNVAIICACAPSLKSFFGTFFRDHLPKSGGSGKNISGSSDFIDSFAVSRTRSDKNNIVLVERSVEVKNSFRDDPELSPWPLEYQSSRDGREKEFGKLFRQSTTRTTQIIGGRLDDSPIRSESRRGIYDKKEQPTFLFFPDTDEDEIEFRFSPRGARGYL